MRRLIIAIKNPQYTKVCQGLFRIISMVQNTCV